MAKRIILDVDTGSDDAVAILLAALNPQLQLEAVCSVAGNKPIENTTENTLRVLELLVSDVPMYRGASSPIVRDICPWRQKFEERTKTVVDGKEVQIHSDYLPLPAATRKPEAMPAPMFYVDYLMKQTEPVTIVAVGPLTNVALALLIEPRITQHIEEIVIMGGGCEVSNSSSSAEFNIWFDPEAAHRVLQCGVKITMVPLDATHRATVSYDDCARFREIGTPAAMFAISQIEQRIVVHDAAQPLAAKGSCALHDPLAVAYLIDPTVLKDVRFCHVDVSLTGLTDGQTVVDQRYYQDNRNCYFAFDGDREKFVDLLADAFARNK